MKKILLFLIGSTVLSASAWAAQQGGFIGPGSNATQTHAVKSVAEAKNLADDSKVVLEGNIVRQIDKDHYVFQDASGTLTAEINHDKWQGQTIKPGDTALLEGKIDKDANKTEIDVKRLTRQ